ncbi:MAG: phospholipase D family protein [Gammaproteobacteria bacterium]|nr:MAG: phospholipase D family protein [Gammaproteobacteria bacterium]
MTARLFSLLVLLLLGGCSSLPVDYPRQSSTAYDKPGATSIAKIFSNDLADHPGKSACLLLTEGEQAFLARKAMIDIAEHTVDMQYFIWKQDEIGKILIHALLQAADRGVRVRLLLDDYGSSELHDLGAALLATHPNVEVRLYNPFVARDLEGLQLLFNLDRLNHRMHNKALVVDNVMAVMGGRNIGNEYFDVHTSANFRDLDVATVGPVVPDISASFDNFWNSDWAIPIDALRERPAQEEFDAARKKLGSWYESLQDFPYPLDKQANENRQRLVELKRDFTWVHVEVLGDEPDKPDTKEESEIIRVIRQLMDDLQEEIQIENAYFIPRDRGVTVLENLHQRGVSVRVLTNSLASNDMLPAHAGYSRYRKRLLEGGIQLFELRPDAGGNLEENRTSKTRSAKSTLHTKSIVFDRKRVIIGTMNLDPRSVDLNTEIVLYIENEDLAQQVADYLDSGVRPENSYRLKLQGSDQLDEADTQQQKIVWVTEENGKRIMYTSEPEAGLFQKLGVFFLNLLPIEDYL